MVEVNPIPTETEEENEELTKSEKIKLDTAEISKKIRKELKQEFKELKFSVTIDRYAGGSSITIALMEAPFKVFRDIGEIDQMEIMDLGEFWDRDKVEKAQEEARKRGYKQLNPYSCRNEDDNNNGVFLTEKAQKTLKKAVEIADQYNYDESRLQEDYYEVNFSFSVDIGKHNKPFKRTE